MKNIYKLKLHEVANICEKCDGCGNEYIEVIRVAGGWIYKTIIDGKREDSQAIVSTCFVPFDNEFMN